MGNYAVDLPVARWNFMRLGCGVFEWFLANFNFQVQISRDFEGIGSSARLYVPLLQDLVHRDIAALQYRATDDQC